MDHLFAGVLLVIAIAWLALAIAHHLRTERARSWEAHVTSAPGVRDPCPRCPCVGRRDARHGMKTPMMDVGHFDGLVTIAVPSSLARDIAAIWSIAHSTDPILAETRPDWHRDVIDLIVHSARADEQRDQARAAKAKADTVLVPVLKLAAFDDTQTSPAQGVGAPSEPPAPPVPKADEGGVDGPASAGEPHLQVVSR